MLVDPACGAGRGGCREVGAAASHLQDPGVPRPPPRPGPRPGAPALTARPWLLSASRAPAALLRQPGRGWQAASAGRTRGAGQSQGRGPRRGRRSGCAALRAPVGRTLRRAARQEPASAVVGRAKATLSLRPPALLPPARRQRRFPPGETTRILPGAPRPARSPPPPPGWGAGVGPRGGGGSGSPSQEVAGGGGAPLVTHSPCHVTRSSAQRPHARPGPAPRRAAHHAPAGTRAPAARAPARAASRPPQAGRAAGAAPAALLLHRPGLLQRNRRAHGLLR